jgi:hypothetical protein
MIHVPSTEDASPFLTSATDNTKLATRQAMMRRLDSPIFIDIHPIPILRKGRLCNSAGFPDSVSRRYWVY